LHIARTHPGRFRQLFLGQIPACAQSGKVFPKSRAVRTNLWLARWHCQIVAQSRPTKHEALHRDFIFLKVLNSLPPGIEAKFLVNQNVTVLLLAF
jgi:hypothetical protein